MSEVGSPPSPSVRAGGDSGRFDLAAGLRAACLAVPGVFGLSSGRFGEVGTYGPGGRVEGVRLRDDVVEVHVLIRWEAPLLQVADDVRTAVRAVLSHDERRIDVVVQDISAPADPTS